MKIACLQFNPIQENTYVVWDDTLEAVVIDAGNSNPREDAALDNFIAEHGLRPVLAANTHGHFDHTLGVAHLKKRYGIRSTFHMLRHDLASRMKQSARFDLKDIQAQLGHSTIQVTMDIYTHIDDQQKAAVSTWLENDVGNIIETTTPTKKRQLR